MEAFSAPGLPAAWLNAWLAGLGVTVLVPDARLSWSDEATPTAAFHHDGLLEALVAAFPTAEELEHLAITRWADGVAEFPRRVPVAAYRDRARRSLPGDVSLAATVTDLAPGSDDPIAHSPFDPTVPKGLTIHQRLMACHSRIDDPARSLAATLAGRGRRHPLNGLGFDYTRLVGPTVPGRDNFVDPVVEVLAFVGLTFVPVRGDGRRVRTRGWATSQSRRGAFTWPAWPQPLDAAAIDGLLDRFWGGAAVRAVAVFGSVAYQPRGSADATRGYASERIR